MSRRSPLRLPLGTRVRFASFTRFGYNKKRQREEERVALPDGMAQEGVICGATWRHVGTYVASWSMDGDYDPPHLKIERSVRLYKVRTSLWGREYLCQPDQIEVIQ